MGVMCVFLRQGFKYEQRLCDAFFFYPYRLHNKVSLT